jgi:hypothetical protein
VSDPIHKCLSMGGAGVLRQDDHPQDYRLWGNREYLRDDSATHWVKLWVSWYELQESFKPSSQTSSWKQLNSAPNGQNYMRRLDRQVKAANEDNAGVIICLQQAFPTWSSGATGIDPNSSRRTGPGRGSSPTFPLATTAPTTQAVRAIPIARTPAASETPSGPSPRPLRSRTSPTLCTGRRRTSTSGRPR